MHTLSGAPIPIWIANYVLLSYGTCAVMAVPAHDARDLGFGFSYVDGGPWDYDGIKSIVRLISRIGKVLERYAALAAAVDVAIGAAVSAAAVNASRKVPKSPSPEVSTLNADLEYIRHFTIKHVIESMEYFSFNTAIARIMEYLNAIQKYQARYRVAVAPSTKKRCWRI